MHLLETYFLCVVFSLSPTHSPHSQSGEAIGSAVHSPLGVAPDEPAVEGMDTAEQLPQSAGSTATAGELCRY